MGDGYVGSWSVDSGAMRSQKVFGLYSVENHKVEKWSCRVGRVAWAFRKCMVCMV